MAGVGGKNRADDAILMALSGDIMNWTPPPSLPKFRDSRGRLTSHALACGHVEVFTTPMGVKIRLWRDGAWHVRAIGPDGVRLFWDSFPKLGAARNRFERAKRELQ